MGYFNLPKFFLSSQIHHHLHILFDQTNLEISDADNRSLAFQKSLVDERNVNRLKIPQDGFHIVPDTQFIIKKNQNTSHNKTHTSIGVARFVSPIF